MEAYPDLRARKSMPLDGRRGHVHSGGLELSVVTFVGNLPHASSEVKRNDKMTFPDLVKASQSLPFSCEHVCHKSRET